MTWSRVSFYLSITEWVAALRSARPITLPGLYREGQPRSGSGPETPSKACAVAKEDLPKRSSSDDSVQRPPQIITDKYPDSPNSPAIPIGPLQIEDEKEYGSSVFIGTDRFHSTNKYGNLADKDHNPTIRAGTIPIRWKADENRWEVLLTSSEPDKRAELRFGLPSGKHEKPKPTHKKVLEQVSSEIVAEIDMLVEKERIENQLPLIIVKNQFEQFSSKVGCSEQHLRPAEPIMVARENFMDIFFAITKILSPIAKDVDHPLRAQFKETISFIGQFAVPAQYEGKADLAISPALSAVFLLLREVQGIVSPRDGPIGLQWGAVEGGYRLEFTAPEFRRSLRKAAIRETDEEGGLDSNDPNAVVVDLNEWVLNLSSKPGKVVQFTRMFLWINPVEKNVWLEDDRVREWMSVPAAIQKLKESNRRGFAECMERLQQLLWIVDKKVPPHTFDAEKFWAGKGHKKLQQVWHDIAHRTNSNVTLPCPMCSTVFKLWENCSLCCGSNMSCTPVVRRRSVSPFRLDTARDDQITPKPKPVKSC